MSKEELIYAILEITQTTPELEDRAMYPDEVGALDDALTNIQQLCEKFLNEEE